MNNEWPWTAEKQANILNQMIDKNGAIKHTPKDLTKKNARLPFQHDRDRIVWSSSFKRLAYKTQVFPNIFIDHQRQRMTHSLEVMQLSSSIARTLGINPILCEAIALAHDLGHTPFGHAGEDALDNAMSNIKIVHMESKTKGLERFTHYEQGVDVVSYIDSLHPDEDATGLHLDHNILEGILKHTFDLEGSVDKHKSLNPSFIKYSG